MMLIFWLICISATQRSSGQQLGRVPSALVDIGNPGERGLIPAQPFWPPELNPVTNTTSSISSKETKPKRLAHAQAHLDEVTSPNVRVQDHGYRAAPEGTSKPLPPVILNALEELKANPNASKPVSNENNNAHTIPKTLVSNQPQLLPSDEESSYTNIEPTQGNIEQSRKAFLSALHRLAILTGNKHDPQKQPLETNFSFQVGGQPPETHTDGINPNAPSSFSSSPHLNSVTFTTNSDINQGSFNSLHGGNTGSVIHKNTLLPNGGEHFSHQTTTLFNGGNHSATHSGNNFLQNGLNSPSHNLAPNTVTQHQSTLGDPHINHVQQTHFTSNSDKHQHSFDSHTPQLQEPFISFNSEHSIQPHEESLQFVKSSAQTGTSEHEIQPHQLHSSTFSHLFPKSTESPVHTHFQVHTNDQPNQGNPFNSPHISTFSAINHPPPTGIHSGFHDTPSQLHHKPEQNSKQLIPFNEVSNPLQNEGPHSHVKRPFIPTERPKLPEVKPALPSGRPLFPAEKPQFPANKPELPENRPLLPDTHSLLPTGVPLQGDRIQLQVERPVSHVSHPDLHPQRPIHQIEITSPHAPFHSTQRPQHTEMGSLNRRPLHPVTESVTERPTFTVTKRPQNSEEKPINTLQSHILDKARPSTIPAQPNNLQSHSFRPNNIKAGTPQTLHRPTVFSPPTIHPTLHHHPLSQNLFALHQHTPSHSGVPLQQNNHLHQNDRPIHTTTKRPTILTTTLRPSIHTTTEQPTQLRGKGLKQDDDPFSSIFEALNKQVGKNLQENDQSNASEEYEEYYYYYYDYEDDDTSPDTIQNIPEKNVVANFPTNHENTRFSGVNQRPQTDTLLNGVQTPLRRPRPDGPITPPPSFLPPRPGHHRNTKVTHTQEPLSPHHEQDETSNIPANHHKQPRPNTNFRRGHSFSSISRPSQEIPHSFPATPNQNTIVEVSSTTQSPKEIPHIFTTTHRPPTNLAHVFTSPPQSPPFGANVLTSTHRPPQELTHVFPSTPRPLQEIPQGITSTHRPITNTVQTFTSIPKLSQEAVQASTSKPPRHTIPTVTFTPRPLLPQVFASAPRPALPHFFNFAPVTPQSIEAFTATPRPPQSTAKTLNPHLVPTTFPQSALINHTPIRSSTDSEREHHSASTTSTPKQLLSVTESPSAKPAALPKPPSFEITAPPKVEPPSFQVKPPPPKSKSPIKDTAQPIDGKTLSTLKPANIITPQSITKSPVIPFAPPLQLHRGPHVPIPHSPLVYVHPQFQPQFHPLHSRFQMPFSPFGVPAQYQTFVQPNAQFAHTPLHFRNAQPLFHSVDPRLHAQITPQFQTTGLHPFQAAFPQQYLRDPRLQFRLPLNHVTRTPLKSPLLTSPKSTNTEESLQDTSPSTLSSSSISKLPVYTTVRPQEFKDTDESLDLHEETEDFDFTGIDNHRTVLLPPSQLLRLQQNNKRLLKPNHRQPVYFPLSEELDETVRQGRDVEDLYNRSLSKERMNASFTQQPLQQSKRRSSHTNAPRRRTNRQPFRSQQIRLSRRKSQALASKPQDQEVEALKEPLTKNETTQDQLYESEHQYQDSTSNTTLDDSIKNLTLNKTSRALSNHTENTVPSPTREITLQTEEHRLEQNITSIVNNTGLISSTEYVTNSSVDVFSNRTEEVIHTPQNSTNYTKQHITEELNSTKTASSTDNTKFSAELPQNVINISTDTPLQNPTTSKAYSTISKQPYNTQATQANTTEENTSLDELKNINADYHPYAQSNSSFSPEFNVSSQNNTKEISEANATQAQTNLQEFLHNHTDISTKGQEKQSEEEFSSTTQEIPQTNSKQKSVSSDNLNRSPGSNGSDNTDKSENSTITILNSTSSDLPSNSSEPDTQTTAEDIISHNSETQIRLKRTYSPINTSLESLEENIDMSDLSTSLEKPELLKTSKSSSTKMKSATEIGGKESDELENSEPETSTKFDRLPLLDLGVIKVFNQENDLSQSHTNNASAPILQSGQSEIPPFTTESIQDSDNSIPNPKGWKRNLPSPEVQIPMPSPALSGLPFYIKGHRNLGQFFMVALD